MSAKRTAIDTTATLNPAASAAGAETCCANLPPPVEQHIWLQRFVGEWEAEVEAFMGPDQPPMKTKGVETARMLGGFWLVSEGRNTEFPYSFIFTLGYDPAKSRYVATWVDTMSGHLWNYEGGVDTAGQILTLETEGPAPMASGKRCKFRETTRFTSADHRLFTSAMLGDDGKWIKVLTVNSWRKK